MGFPLRVRGLLGCNCVSHYPNTVNIRTASFLVSLHNTPYRLPINLLRLYYILNMGKVACPLFPCWNFCICKRSGNLQGYVVKSFRMLH
jgi:hypothetical protein